MILFGLIDKCIHKDDFIFQNRKGGFATNCGQIAAI
jgi:hypothetical protein